MHAISFINAEYAAHNLAYIFLVRALFFASCRLLYFKIVFVGCHCKKKKKKTRTFVAYSLHQTQPHTHSAENTNKFVVYLMMHSLISCKMCCQLGATIS